MIALIDRGLYNRTKMQFQSIPEERAMRHLAICMSLLADRVEDLEYQRVDAEKWVTHKVLKKQDDLHSKVRDQDAECEASS